MNKSIATRTLHAMQWVLFNEVFLWYVRIGLNYSLVHDMRQTVVYINQDSIYKQVKS